MLDFVKSATCLMLDKRLLQTQELHRQFKTLFPDKKFNTFIAGTEPYDYDDITRNRCDTNELPPIFHNTTSYATWRNKPGAFNAWKCHAQIFMEFLWTNEKYLWLLEDDCEFTEDAKEVLEKFDEKFKLHNGGLFFAGLYLGYYSNGNVRDWHIDPVRVVKGVAGFHSVILHREVIKRMLHDTNFLPIGPFDECVQKYHTNANFQPFYCVYPQVCLQRSGYSFVEQGNLEKPDRYKI